VTIRLMSASTAIGGSSGTRSTARICWNRPLSSSSCALAVAVSKGSRVYALEDVMIRSGYRRAESRSINRDTFGRPEV